MINEVCKDAKIRMLKCIESFKAQISKFRTGRATPNLLDDIQIDYYGSTMPLRHLANIVAENRYTLLVTVFDMNLASAVQKAILSSNLGLNPYLSGAVIRVPLPPLTEERRRDLIKLVRSEAEQGRVSIRNVRRDSLDKLKTLLKDKIIGEDEDLRLHQEIQKITDVCIKNIDNLLTQKEAELIDI